jgi:hypothetical protein
MASEAALAEILSVPNWYVLPLVVIFTLAAPIWAVWSLRRVFRRAEDGRNYRPGAPW